MMPRTRPALLGSALLLASFSAQAEPETTHRWSVTGVVAGTAIESQEADDGVAGFFDQFTFTANKGTRFPLELGVRDAVWDIFTENDTPRLQIRYESPTSNLGISGAGIDEPFWNQHATARGRFEAVAFDLELDSQRTEELRRFPETSGGALALQDLTAPDERFARERSGFLAELRLDPAALGDTERDLHGLELSLRGGFQARQGPRQQVFLLQGGNDWLSLSNERDHEVAEVGAGVLVSPRRRFTLAFDFDHERFRQRADELQESALPAPLTGGTRSIGFVPDTDRSTGTVRLRGRPVDRLRLEAGFQLSQLEQVDDFTFEQRSAGLDENRVRTFSARTSADLRIVGPLSGRAWFKWDRRDNEIDRGTALFSATSGTQVGAFLRRRERYRGGAELRYRFGAGQRAAVGFEADAVDRSLDFAAPGAARIQAANSLVGDESRRYTVYGRTQLRPVRGVRGVAELGYRESPETGYSTELDDELYGKLRVSVLLPFERTVQVTAFGSGSRGVNRDFDPVSNTAPGPAPDGPTLDRELERWDYLAGLTVNAAPWRELRLHGTFFASRNALDHDLVLSSAQRSVQDFAPVSFSSPDEVEYRFDLRSVILGGHYPIGERSDASLAYSFTRADSSYGASSSSTQLDLAADRRRVDSDTHGIDLELGHWLRDGIRLELAYRLQLHEDRVDVPTSQGSAATPFDRSELRHRVALAVTLTDAWLSER